MTALRGREVDRTLSAAGRYRTGLRRSHPAQAGGKDAGQFVEAFGRCHVVGIKRTQHIRGSAKSVVLDATCEAMSSENRSRPERFHQAEIQKALNWQLELGA